MCPKPERCEALSRTLQPAGLPIRSGRNLEVRPTLTDRKGEVLFISTPKGHNHFFDLHELEKTDTDFKSFNYTSCDNPNIPYEEIDSARAQLTEDRFAQEYLADFRKTEGLVYKEFDRTQHIFDELLDVRYLETISGVDFGYNHPAVADQAPGVQD